MDLKKSSRTANMSKLAKKLDNHLVVRMARCPTILPPLGLMVGPVVGHNHLVVMMARCSTILPPLGLMVGQPSRPFIDQAVMFGSMT